jgi:predicted tellurium resistance membrane protein TerC
MELFTSVNILSLFTLTGLEIVLGIDNVIFIALLVQHLKGKQRNRARFIGLSLALIIRVLMLFCASWIMQLKDPLFSLPISGRSLLLIIGGLFLVIKSVMELIELFHEEAPKQSEEQTKECKYLKIISQIIFIDIILSFDSIITAVGISNNLSIMVIAVVIAIIVMLLASDPIGKYIYANPSIKVLALAFIGFLGVILVFAGFNIEINKGYLYFSMLFAGIVEVLNIKLDKKS